MSSCNAHTDFKYGTGCGPWEPTQQAATVGAPSDDPHAYSRRCAAAEFQRGPWGKYATPPAVQAQSVEQPNPACKSVQKRLATQRGYVQALTDERLDLLIEKHLRSYWSYGAVEQDKLRRAVREIIGAAAQGGE